MYEKAHMEFQRKKKISLTKANFIKKKSIVKIFENKAQIFFPICFPLNKRRL